MKSAVEEAEKGRIRRGERETEGGEEERKEEGGAE